MTAAAEGGLRRILFVDDEPSILAGLRNLLRNERKRWEMVFACGGDQGMEQLDAARFDVVVCDMRMPRIDGAALLTYAKNTQPAAVRIVLSGQTDGETATRMVLIAHQFLAKPCDAATLRDTIARALTLSHLIQDETLKAAAGDVSNLPPAPEVYRALTEVMASQASSMIDVAAIFARDVGLTAKIMQIVNSAFFGLPRKVTTVSDATTMLGLTTLKNLVLAANVFANPTGNCSAKELAILQRHSLLTAAVARHLMLPDKPQADAAFVAGMLHDIGYLIDSKRPRTAGAGAAGTRVSHAHLGAYLLGIWGLPFPIIEAVARHEETMAIPHDGLDLVDAVHIANAIAEEVIPDHLHAETPVLDPAYLASRGVGPDRLAAWVTAARSML